MLEQASPVAVADPQVAEIVAAPPEVLVVAMRPAAGPEAPIGLDPDDVTLLAGWGVDLPRRLSRAGATAARSEVVWIDLEAEAPRAVLVVGLGSGSTADLRSSAAAAGRRLRKVGEVLVLATRGLDPGGVAAFTEGMLLATPTPTWASKPADLMPARVRIAVSELASGEPAVARGAAHARATVAARELIHTPPNIKSPAWLADRAATAAQRSGLSARIWDPDALRRDGFGGILAVGAGSSRPPRLVVLGHEPAAGTRSARHVVLVGKGITFDSGGLSLKPAELQIGMRTDMAGAAVVCAVMAALPGRVPPDLRVTGVLCLAENLPGSAAMRPGDVVTHHGGITSEIVNTDAEGRLVLGDGLDLAVNDLAADVVVDIATLTGAARLGLGRRYAPLYSTTDALADALVSAGTEAGELLWRMPLVDGYAELIESDVADQANSVRRAGHEPGSITAALFLRRFVGDTPWAHLDIAGTGRADAERDELPKGGTGFGARLLLRWLEAGAPY